MEGLPQPAGALTPPPGHPVPSQADAFLVLLMYPSGLLFLLRMTP